MNRAQICLLAVALSFPLSAVSADLDALTKECDSCHGRQGASTNSDVPIIGGQSSKYIADSLALYQDWGRPCIKSAAAKQDFDQTRASTGAILHEKHCFSCHPESGNVAGRGPILAGQWAGYLKAQVGQALTGEHLVPPLMERQFIEFSIEEIDALLNFYASQQ